MNFWLCLADYLWHSHDETGMNKEGLQFIEKFSIKGYTKFYPSMLPAVPSKKMRAASPNYFRSFQVKSMSLFLQNYE